MEYRLWYSIFVILFFTKGSKKDGPDLIHFLEKTTVAFSVKLLYIVFCCVFDVEQTQYFLQKTKIAVDNNGSMLHNKPTNTTYSD